MHTNEKRGAARRLPSLATVVMAMLAFPALAQQGNLAKEIEGTWNLASNYNEQDGKRMEPFGANPRGVMILTAGGRFAIMMMKASLPAFAANNRMQGSAEENQAVVQGSVAYFGTYSVASEKDRTVSLRIEGSTFPNWVGQEQKRVMNVDGDQMNLINPSAAVGGTNYVVFKRAR
jgi:hypothetical protein